MAILNKRRAKLEGGRGTGLSFSSRGVVGWWLELVTAVWHRIFEDRLATTASSVAFYVVLASVPGIAAVISVYGLLSNPNDVVALSSILDAMLPPRAAQMLNQQITRIVASQAFGATSAFGSLGWFGVLLWSADRGMKSLVDALNTIYDRGEERGFFHRSAVVLVLTLGAVLLLVATLFGLFLLPVVFKLIGFDENMARMMSFLRWPFFLILAGTALALLYRIGPSRKNAEWRFIALGSGIGAALWIVFSLAFSWYVPRFGSFTALYGSLGATAAFMFWLWLSILAVLIGAEIDSGANR